MFSGSQKLNK